MKAGAVLLNFDVVTSAQDLAIFGYEASSNGSASLGQRLSSFLEGDDETGFLRHLELELLLVKVLVLVLVKYGYRGRWL